MSDADTTTHCEYCPCFEKDLEGLTENQREIVLHEARRLAKSYRLMNEIRDRHRP